MTLNIENGTESDLENYAYILSLTVNIYITQQTSDNSRGFAGQKMHFKSGRVQHSQLNACIPSDDLK